jgi:hypothetical protein
MPSVGEVRSSGDETRRWNGQGWELVAVQDSEPSVKLPEGDVNSQVVSPEFQAIREAGMDHGAAEAAPLIATTLATAGLGGLTATSGAIPAAARAAMSPVGAAALGGGLSAVSGGGPGDIAVAAGKGYLEGKGLGVIGKVIPLPKFLKAKLAHAVARTVKEAAEVAPEAKAVAKAAPAVKEAASSVLPGLASTGPDELAERITKLAGAGLSRGQIAEQLRTELAAGMKGIGVGRFRKMTDWVLDNAAKAGAK